MVPHGGPVHGDADQWHVRPRRFEAAARASVRHADRRRALACHGQQLQQWRGDPWHGPLFPFNPHLSARDNNS